MARLFVYRCFSWARQCETFEQQYGTACAERAPRYPIGLMIGGETWFLSDDLLSAVK